MPKPQVNFSDEEQRILEKVRLEEGLETIEEAAEWLLKANLRINSKKYDGRGRALYLINQETPK